MSASSLARLQSLFDAAFDLQPDERGAFLDQACAGDAALRAQLEQLLRTDHATHDVVQRAVANAARSLMDGAAQAGRMLGPYRLLHELGHGGMGTVWLAERADASYRARVAIKLIRGGFASRDLAHRFREERQILADLHHPNIATLLDGGEAPDGTPFLVLEHIEGSPITAWVRARKLALDARLRLFRRVCDAVQYAHASLVVHRDIKPSNILVDASGAPKLLDFGIAKLLREDASTDTTAIARRLTPSYASPEQLTGARITVATDVHALGVLLYELLTETHPFATDDTSPEELRRRVLEVDPPRPSDVLRRTGASPSVAARDVAGDLDNIVAKALRKEPEARYASVQALSDDLGRMLAGEPVLARPATPSYRLRKFISRHAGALVAATLVLVALVGGLATTLWQARRAEAARVVADQARQSAEAALAQANEVKSFLTSLFTASDPDRVGGREVTARELLEQGVARVDELEDQPALQADVLGALAQVQFSRGLHAEARALREREIAIRRRIGPPDSLLVIAINSRGQALNQLGMIDSSNAAFREALDIGLPLLGQRDHTLQGTANNLALNLFRVGRNREAEAEFRRMLTALGPDDGMYPVVLNNLGFLMLREGRYAEADSVLRITLALELAGDSARVRIKTATAYELLGTALSGAGRYDEAEEMLRTEVEIDERARGPLHPHTTGAYYALGLMLAARGGPEDLREADSLLHLAYRNAELAYGKGHRFLAVNLFALGVLAMSRDDPREAEGWFREALALRRRNPPQPSQAIAELLLWLGSAQAASRQPDAVRTLREADSLARASLDALDPIRNRVAIALALAARETDPAAARGFAPAVEALAGRIGAQHPLVREACARGAAAGLTGSGCDSGPALVGRR